MSYGCLYSGTYFIIVYIHRDSMQQFFFEKVLRILGTFILSVLLKCLVGKLLKIIP